VPDLTGSISLVGLIGGECFGTAARQALSEATLLVGAARHLAALPDGLPGKRVELRGALGDVLDRVEADRHSGEKVCVVVSGDPGFFGLARLARARFGRGVAVHPAPSSVALACARAGLAWDDAVVVSAHGRPLDAAVEAILDHDKVAVLTSPDQPPELVGRALLARGRPDRDVTVVSRLGEPGERVWCGDIIGLASGDFDALSVVVCHAPAPPSSAGPAPAWAWGLPEAAYRHRNGMITKAEVRAVALGKLRLPAAGILWDIGAGSGSVAAECARLAPGLRVFAVERQAAAGADLRRNLVGTAASVVIGDAPGCLPGLPDPDRVFVGGGGLGVLEAVLGRLRPDGTVVATYTSMDRAAAAAVRLGHLVQVAVSRAVPIGATGSVRLHAENPVFVCWGPPE
jgi:precorrin-6B C5,15-methyltransferase / cobalt-precorrin-6B C5,C15-methyltransferase